MPRKASLSNLEHAIELYCTGESLDEVADLTHTSLVTLRALLRDRGLLRTKSESNALRATKTSASRRALLGLPEDEIVSRYLVGESENALAHTFSVSRNAIRARLLHAGITTRNSLSANRLMMLGRTVEENWRNTTAAHIAVKGKKRSFDELCNRALIKERCGFSITATETLLSVWLRQRGYLCIQQKAIGPYNADIAVSRVTVECNGGNWHAYGKHAATFLQKAPYLFNHDWNLVIVWIKQQKISEVVADYIAAFVEETRSNPTMSGQYRVIWGDGEVVSTDTFNIDDLARIPPRHSRYNIGT